MAEMTRERSIPMQLTRSAAEGSDGDGLTLEGMAAMFGESTRIDSWEGQFDEQIKPGAFRKSLREHKPVMQFDHGRHPVVGSIPIGVITDLQETDDGLFVAARLSDNWLIQPVRDAIEAGSISGMSFRFSVVREEWTDAQGKRVGPEELDALLWAPGERGPLQRTLTEVKLHELGPVVFPAYAGTSVGVRARDLASTIREDEGLRRDVQLSLAHKAAVPEGLADPALRQEVARALLFGSTAEPGPGLHERITGALGKVRASLVAARAFERQEVLADVRANMATMTIPTRAQAQAASDGFWFSERAEQLEAARLRHVARRKRADAEVTGRERLFAHLRNTRGLDYAEAWMAGG